VILAIYFLHHFITKIKLGKIRLTGRKTWIKLYHCTQ